MVDFRRSEESIWGIKEDWKVEISGIWEIEVYRRRDRMSIVWEEMKVRRIEKIRGGLG